MAMPVLQGIGIPPVRRLACRLSEVQVPLHSWTQWWQGMLFHRLHQEKYHKTHLCQKFGHRGRNRASRVGGYLLRDQFRGIYHPH